MGAILLLALFAIGQVKPTSHGCLVRLELKAGVVHTLRDSMWESFNDSPLPTEPIVGCRTLDILSVKGDTAKVRYKTFVKNISGKFGEVKSELIDLKSNGEPFFDDPVLLYWDEPFDSNTRMYRKYEPAPGMEFEIVYSCTGRPEPFQKRTALKITAKIFESRAKKAAGTQTSWIDANDGWLLSQETDVKMTVRPGMLMHIHSKLERIDSLPL